MPQNVVSLAAVTGTGVGGVVDLGVSASKFTMCYTITGAPATVSLKLQGSHDATNWFDIATSTATASGATSSFDLFVARYLRANLGTLTGGTAPTVTATVGAGGVVY